VVFEDNKTQEWSIESLAGSKRAQSKADDTGTMRPTGVWARGNINYLANSSNSAMILAVFLSLA